MESLTFAPLNRPYNLGTNPEEATQKLHKDLKIIANSRWVRISDDGDFEQISLIKWVVENIRGILGFVDHTKIEVLRLRLQQLLAQAAEKGLLTKDDCFGPKNLVFLVGKKIGLIQKNATREAKELNEFFKNVLQKVANPSENKPDLNRFVERYRARHMEDLQPHSLPWKIVNAWHKQTRPLNEENDEDATQSEFGSSQEQETEGGASGFSDKPMYQQPENQEFVAPTKTAQPLQFIPPTPSQVGQLTNKTPIVQQEEKKSYNTDFLEKISNIDDLRDELEKMTPSAEVSYKELYLRHMLASPLQRTDYDALVNEWVSDTLSMTNNWSSQWTQKAVNLDRTLSALDFKNSLSLLVAGFRLALLVKNEEEKQFEPSDQLISQCILAKEAFGSRLKALIDSNQKEFLSLNLVSFSPKELRFHKDTLSYQFLKILSDQQKLRLENEKIANWYKLTGIGILGAGALLSGAAYALVRQFTYVPPPPPPPVQQYFPSLSDAFLGLGYAIPLVAIAGIAYHCFTKPKKTSSSGKEKSDAVALPTITPEEVKGIASSSLVQRFNFNSNTITSIPNLLDPNAISYPAATIAPTSQISEDRKVCTLRIEDARIHENFKDEITNAALIHKDGEQYLVIRFSDVSLGFCVCLNQFNISHTKPVKEIIFSEGGLEIQLNAAKRLYRPDDTADLTSQNEEAIRNLKELITRREGEFRSKFERLSVKPAKLEEHFKFLKTLLTKIDDIKPKAEDAVLKIETCTQESQLIFADFNHALRIRFYGVQKTNYKDTLDNLPPVSEENELQANALITGIRKQFKKITQSSSSEKLVAFERALEDFKERYAALADIKKDEKGKEIDGKPDAVAEPETKAKPERRDPPHVKEDRKPEVNETKEKLDGLYNQYSAEIPLFCRGKRDIIGNLSAKLQKDDTSADLFQTAEKLLKSLETLLTRLRDVDNKQLDAEITFSNIEEKIRNKKESVEKIIEEITSLVRLSEVHSKEGNNVDEAVGNADREKETTASEGKEKEGHEDTVDSKNDSTIGEADHSEKPYGASKPDGKNEDTPSEIEEDKEVDSKGDNSVGNAEDEAKSSSSSSAKGAEKEVANSKISQRYKELEVKVREFTEDTRKPVDPKNKDEISSARKKVKERFDLIKVDNLEKAGLENLEKFLTRSSKRVNKLLLKLASLPSAHEEADPVKVESKSDTEELDSTEGLEKEKEVDPAITVRYEQLSKKVEKFTGSKKDVSDLQIQLELIKLQKNIEEKFAAITTDNLDMNQLDEFEGVFKEASKNYLKLIEKASKNTKHHSSPGALDLPSKPLEEVEVDEVDEELLARISKIGDTYRKYDQLPSIIKDNEDLLEQANNLLEKAKEVEEFLGKIPLKETELLRIEGLIENLKNEYEQIIQENERRISSGDEQGSTIGSSQNESSSNIEEEVDNSDDTSFDRSTTYLEGDELGHRPTPAGSPNADSSSQKLDEDTSNLEASFKSFSQNYDYDEPLDAASDEEGAQEEKRPPSVEMRIISPSEVLSHKVEPANDDVDDELPPLLSDEEDVGQVNLGSRVVQTEDIGEEYDESSSYETHSDEEEDLNTNSSLPNQNEKN